MDELPTDNGLCSRGSESANGRVVAFPSTSPNDLRVSLYDTLKGVPMAELEVSVSYAMGKYEPYIPILLFLKCSSCTLLHFS
nr:hypothetical protein [Sulfolobus islandicus]